MNPIAVIHQHRNTSTKIDNHIILTTTIYISDHHALCRFGVQLNPSSIIIQKQPNTITF
ncbi:hypothetical protein THIOM_003366 [Candidatus Thiomargarita nelsonii]|uniref:Uncharacterized protein n=1 Tax=Candidatus Thiomargarita nelsonii TaxID=1003181 RepID=A0A176RYX0_9GAMM|nr:hypothetical protein THIOM_003366 [Candidatus Thiomargarita nelsonii]